MLWIITQDHISERCCKTLGEPVVTHVGKVGTRNPTRKQQYAGATPERKAELLEQYKEECDFEFRLYSDDRELYYEGICKNLDNQDGDNAFAPLDWAMRNDGCTYMQYRKKGHAIWRTL